MLKERREKITVVKGWTFILPPSQTLVSLPRIDSTTQTEELLLAIQNKRRNKRVAHHSSFLKRPRWLLS